MTAMKLFRLLQTHVGTLNDLALRVSDEKVSAQEGQEKAIAELEKTLAEIKGT